MRYYARPLSLVQQRPASDVYKCSHIGQSLFQQYRMTGVKDTPYISIEVKPMKSGKGPSRKGASWLDN
jgi:hypothetical protein